MEVDNMIFEFSLLDGSVRDFAVVQLNSVVDIGENQEIVGIEILDFRFFTKELHLDYLAISHQKNLSYDNGCDAFYCNVTEKRSLEQKNALCTLTISEEGMIIKIAVDV